MVSCDKGDYTEIDLRTGDFYVLVRPEPVELAGLADVRSKLMAGHPVLRQMLRSYDSTPHAISDLLRPAEYRRTRLYGDFFSVLGVQDQLTVTVDLGSSCRLAGISVDRSSVGFSPQERVALQRLRPHLRLARDNAEQFSRALTSTMGDVAPAPIERLSSRQLDVLAQVAAGRTNAQIATELCIRHGTVRKHIENILRLLELRSRTAAAVAYVAAQPATPTDTWSAVVTSMVNPSTSPPVFSTGDVAGRR
jgi:DNA-binding CsgD family transcriptional regulator